MKIKIQLWKPKCVPGGALFWASSHPLQTSLMVVLHELSSSNNTGIKQPEQSNFKDSWSNGYFWF
jgi:hypothetical protein